MLSDRIVVRAAALAAVLPVAALLPAPAAGQEDAAPAADAVDTASADADRWAFTIDLAFSGSSGNQDLLVFSTDARISHLLTDLFEFEAGGRVRYGRSAGEVVARALFGDVSFDLYPEAVWSPFLFATVEQDRFRKLDVRANGGGGVKYTFVRGPTSLASISVAGLYSYENYTLSLDSALDDFARKTRWSWRVKGEQELRDGVSLEHTTYYQPLWDDASDYLVDSATRVAVELTGAVGLTFQHRFQRTSLPPEGVERDDNYIEAGIHLAF